MKYHNKSHKLDNNIFTECDSIERTLCAPSVHSHTYIHIHIIEKTLKTICQGLKTSESYYIQETVDII